MSYARKLLRGLKADKDRRSELPRRSKPGSNRRRVTDVSHWIAPPHFQPLDDFAAAFYEVNKEADSHATKGWRVRRLRAQ